MLNCMYNTFGTNSSLNLTIHIIMSIRILVLLQKKTIHHQYKYHLIFILNLRKVRLFVERYRLVARIVARHVAFSCRSINNVDKKIFMFLTLGAEYPLLTSARQKMTKEREAHRS